VPDLNVPDNAPRRLAQLEIATVRPFAPIEEWTARRAWDAIRAALETELTEATWTELFFGTAFLAAGSR
jgi:hypothetical protein